MNIERFKQYYLLEGVQCYIAYSNGIEYAFINNEGVWELLLTKVRKLKGHGFFKPNKRVHERRFVLNTIKRLNDTNKYYGIGDTLPTYLL